MRLPTHCFTCVRLHQCWRQTSAPAITSRSRCKACLAKPRDRVYSNSIGQVTLCTDYVPRHWSVPNQSNLGADKWVRIIGGPSSPPIGHPLVFPAIFRPNRLTSFIIRLFRYGVEACQPGRGPTTLSRRESAGFDLVLSRWTLTSNDGGPHHDLISYAPYTSLLASSVSYRRSSPVSRRWHRC